MILYNYKTLSTALENTCPRELSRVSTLTMARVEVYKIKSASILILALCTSWVPHNLTVLMIEFPIPIFFV